MQDMDWSAVLLDLLNTTPVVDGEHQELLDAEWLTAHGGTGGDVQAVTRLRDDLQDVVRGRAQADTLAGYLDGYVRTPRLDGAGVHWDLNAEPTWPARIILAWSDIQHDSPGRLRECQNTECRLFLLDRTRAGSARWCSMSTCGNRMKARRHYSRETGQRMPQPPTETM